MMKIATHCAAIQVSFDVPHSETQDRSPKCVVNVWKHITIIKTNFYSNEKKISISYFTDSFIIYWSYNDKRVGVYEHIYHFLK